MFGSVDLEALSFPSSYLLSVEMDYLGVTQFALATVLSLVCSIYFHSVNQFNFECSHYFANRTDSKYFG